MIQVKDVEHDELHRAALLGRPEPVRVALAETGAQGGEVGLAVGGETHELAVEDDSANGERLGEAGHLRGLISTRAAVAGAHRERSAVEAHLHPCAVPLHFRRPFVAARCGPSAGEHRLDEAGDAFT